MRSEIVEMFRKQPGEYLSGEEISRRLTVSRTAIWKHMQALKSEGYDIEAHPRLGYRLRQTPDLMLPGEIEACLTTSFLGRNIHYRAAFPVSTNDIAKQLAEAGCPEGQIVVAETQAGGRGRLTRNWFSPYAKGIWFSLVLRPNFRLQDAPKCTLLAAVAVNKAIKKVAGIDSGDKKLVGILTEMSAQIDGINYVVIGIGINVNIEKEEFPSELKESATSLLIAAGHPISRLELLQEVLAEIEKLYNDTKSKGFAQILDEWRIQSLTLGHIVDVFGLGHEFSGRAIDIDADGALLVDTGAAIEKVMAGDVSIRYKKGL
ncbi:MAG: birA [Firmicutes bacterium]|nr:birA [Bacillota bacterium]